MSVIRVYSSINAQTFGLNSLLIDNLIHVSMGLNNMITWDDLGIDVIEQSNLDTVDVEVCIIIRGIDLSIHLREID